MYQEHMGEAALARNVPCIECVRCLDRCFGAVQRNDAQLTGVGVRGSPAAAQRSTGWLHVESKPQLGRGPCSVVQHKTRLGMDVGPRTRLRGVVDVRRRRRAQRNEARDGVVSEHDNAIRRTIRANHIEGQNSRTQRHTLQERQGPLCLLLALVIGAVFRERIKGERTLLRHTQTRTIRVPPIKTHGGDRGRCGVRLRQPQHGGVVWSRVRAEGEICTGPCTAARVRGRAQRPRGLLGARPLSLYKRSYSSNSELLEEVWDSGDIMEGTAPTC